MIEWNSENKNTHTKTKGQGSSVDSVRIIDCNNAVGNNKIYINIFIDINK